MQTITKSDFSAAFMKVGCESRAEGGRGNTEEQGQMALSCFCSILLLHGSLYPAYTIQLHFVWQLSPPTTIKGGEYRFPNKRPFPDSVLFGLFICRICSFEEDSSHVTHCTLSPKESPLCLCLRKWRS